MATIFETIGVLRGAADKIEAAVANFDSESMELFRSEVGQALAEIAAAQEVLLPLLHVGIEDEVVEVDPMACAGQLGMICGEPFGDVVIL